MDRRERISTIKTLGALSTVGFSFVFAILLGVAGGYWVDRWLGTSPWFFLFGFMLGLIAGVLNVVRTSRKFLK